MTTTNYINAFIEVAEDCQAKAAEIPPEKTDKKSPADIQFEMITANPYRYTSDDVLFHVYALKSKINPSRQAEQRKLFVSNGQVCFWSSPLTKRYGCSQQPRRKNCNLSC
jgi:hypothetical protein